MNLHAVFKRRYTVLAKMVFEFMPKCYRKTQTYVLGNPLIKRGYWIRPYKIHGNEVFLHFSC